VVVSAVGRYHVVAHVAALQPRSADVQGDNVILNVLSKT
jgi:hypothetical protein